MPRPTRRRQRGGASDQYILDTINPITLESQNVVFRVPNPESKFVVITYWWGRNNGNKNLHRPCPPAVLPEGTKVTKYDEMIEGPGGWLETCQAAGVNYMAVEYDQFSKDKKYQEAINAKPYFIKKALELCAPRAVVYIDGDMTVNRYPAIFDMEDVDFMARNWNCDPRGKCDYEDNPGADFYTFETSGGIMYFGQTPQARSLLDVWIKATEEAEMAGKADDRILSLIFNNSRLYLPLNFIQLPIEYLWLSIYYDSYMDMSPMKFIDRKTKKRILINPRDYIFIEHPHCLTPEEIARDKSCSKTKSRQPETYNRNVTNRVVNREGGWFHDYIFFENDDQAKAFLPYYYYVGTHPTLYIEEEYDENTDETIEYDIPLFYHVPYTLHYGGTKRINYNEVAMRNRVNVDKLTKQLKSEPKDIDCIEGEISLKAPCKIIKKKPNPLTYVLLFLQRGHNVLYIPENVRPEYLSAVVENANNGANQFITVNNSIMKNPNNPEELYSEYILSIPADAPIYFSASSRILLHLLHMCRSLEDLPTLFNSSFIFLTRIRCMWVARPAYAAPPANMAGAAAPPVNVQIVEPINVAGAAAPPAAAPPVNVAGAAAPPLPKPEFLEPQPILKKSAIFNQVGSNLANALINPQTEEEQNAAVEIIVAATPAPSNENENKLKGGRRRKQKTRKNLRRRRA